MTSTRTHVYTEFANLFLVCDQCQRSVSHWHDQRACGCLGSGKAATNEPCGHTAGVTSTCPSWSPVDGCRCRAHLGHMPHAD